MNTDITSNLQNIIKKSISNVICIDEQYVEPYSKSKPKSTLDIKLSKDMYDAFTRKMNCKTTIFRYKANNKKWRKYLPNQDLLIIDWELTKPQNPDKPLEIIDEAIDKNIPFVCIYTSYTGAQLTEVINYVKAYFSGYSEDDVKDTVINSSLVEINEADVRKIVTGLIYSEKEANAYALKMDEQTDFDIRKADKKIFDFSNYNEWNKLYCKLVCNLLSYSKHCILPKAAREKSIIVDGTYIFFVSKRKEEIIETITDELSREPRSIFNILWTYYFYVLRESIYSKNKLPLRIPAEALKYHATTTIKEEGDKKYFSRLLSMVVDEIVECIVEKSNSLIPDSVLVQELQKQGEGLKYIDVANDLMKLNAIMNMNSELYNNPHNLTMGDMFSFDIVDKAGTTKTKYLMCISALCDCAQPKSIDSETKYKRYGYSFITGEKLVNPNYENTYNPETRKLSFVWEGGDPYYVKWDNSIWGGYVPEKGNVVQQDKIIKVYFGGKGYKLKYICSIKDKYAQRLANDSFSWGLRVGTVYAKASQADKEVLAEEKRKNEEAKIRGKMKKEVEEEVRKEMEEARSLEKTERE